MERLGNNKPTHNTIQRCKVAKDYVNFHFNPCEVINGFWEAGTIVVVFKKEGKLKQTHLYVDNLGMVMENDETIYNRMTDID